MRTFDCPCGNALSFENSICLNCGGQLGYIPNLRTIARINPARNDLWRAKTAYGHAGDFRKCVNYSEFNACNWMIPAADPSPFCHACRLNSVIPDLSVDENVRLWFRIEQAKRRLVYTLDMLGLPVFGKHVDRDRGLAFEFLRDQPGGSDEFLNELGGNQHILTGHKTGIITINIAEADPGARERMRERMSEAYRTLLGHFRHEVAHYYWDLLVRDSEYLERVRALFGDERQNYDEALAAYYANGPVENWPDSHISAYASAHPWEDWAESWAHYLHMADTLETANDLGLSIRGSNVESIVPGNPERLQLILENWSELTNALNALNRSMGLPDAYPFVIGHGAADKLRLIDEIIANAQRVAPTVRLPNRTGATPTASA